ncbi:hypothetical protein PXO_05833 [Xanthomonas oryzae pv. oryzae PXO99A]|uniref:Uncharacterized protein n=1 Tax=Xanthomonas oryzae pv. oryzae (strain PXO99A) TaxID=360094 RepID=A0A0K0GKG1_XANOP|nr:hypothetical protein PXO_05833 [Xanthomonas oryzae pv. oryzae PXO99A]
MQAAATPHESWRPGLMLLRPARRLRSTAAASQEGQAIAISLSANASW